MNREALIAQLAGWIAEITEEETLPVLTDETDLYSDLNLDSLVLAELGSKLSRTHKVKIRPQDLQENLKVGQLVDLVLRLMRQQGTATK